MRDYVGAAHAIDAWLAHRRGDTAAVIASATAAREIWRELELVFPLQWTALVPLLVAHLAVGDLASAVECARALRDPRQQALPESLDQALALVTDFSPAAAATSEPALRQALEAVVAGFGGLRYD